MSTKGRKKPAPKHSVGDTVTVQGVPARVVKHVPRPGLAEHLYHIIYEDGTGGGVERESQIERRSE